MAESDSCSSARGRADAKTHVRGINLPREGCNWASTLSNPGRHLGFRYTYDETVVDRQKVTNLRLPGQYDERLLGSLGLQGPYYNWNRWYLPSLGRYLELDPVAMTGRFNARSFPDWYNYALGNPLRFEDPEGLAAAPIEDPEKCEQLGCDLVVYCSDRTERCLLKRCGRGSCPGCPADTANLIIKAWCEYDCHKKKEDCQGDATGKAVVFITTFGKTRIPICL